MIVHRKLGELESDVSAAVGAPDAVPPDASPEQFWLFVKVGVTSGLIVWGITRFLDRVIRRSP